MTRINHFLPSYVDHDAVGTHVRMLHELLLEMGIDSRIYAGEWRGERSKATYFRDFANEPKSSDDTWLLNHFSIASALTDFLRGRPEKLAMDYHNVTPAELVEAWEPVIGAELEESRRQFESLAAATQFAIGVSEFNQNELQQAGYSPTRVAPILFDTGEFARSADPAVLDKLHSERDGKGANWLFVGRLAPHKCQHDVIKAFWMYRHLYDTNAKLYIVGGISSHRYWTVLNQYVNALELEGAVEITKQVSDAALSAYYKIADVFVGMSEHEGFGVPLLEALFNDLPVVAYSAAAVPETLGEAGILLERKEPAYVAAAVHRVLTDNELSASLSSAGKQQLIHFETGNAKKLWRAVIEEMVSVETVAP